MKGFKVRTFAILGKLILGQKMFRYKNIGHISKFFRLLLIVIVGIFATKKNLLVASSPWPVWYLEDASGSFHAIYANSRDFGRIVPIELGDEKKTGFFTAQEAFIAIKHLLQNIDKLKNKEIQIAKYKDNTDLMANIQSQELEQVLNEYNQSLKENSGEKNDEMKYKGKVQLKENSGEGNDKMKYKVKVQNLSRVEMIHPPGYSGNKWIYVFHFDLVLIKNPNSDTSSITNEKKDIFAAVYQIPSRIVVNFSQRVQ